MHQFARLLAIALFVPLACGDNLQPGENLPPSPYDGITASRTLNVPGLEGPVQIVRDEFGVPHVYASTEYDVAFGFGYVEATDRLPQMDLFRHVASGTISELFGALEQAQIDSDIEMRMHRMRAISEEAWAELTASTDPEDQEMVRWATGFADGVNQYIEETRAASANGENPLDSAVQVWFSIETIQPWTPVDSLTIGRLQTWALSYFASYEIRFTNAFQAAQEAFATADPGTQPDHARRAKAFFDLLSMRPMDPTATIDGFPNVTEDTGTRAKRTGNTSERPYVDPSLLRAAMHTLRDKSINGFNVRDANTGSNNWIVGPGIGGGKPMLANDTHLTLSNPAIFYMVHLTIPGKLDVQGVSFPGIPVILLGHNQHIAWGATVVFHDITDVYLETVVPCASGGGDCVEFNGGEVPIETRTETIQVGAKGTITDTIEVTYETVPHHGPIIPIIENHTTVPRTGNQALSVRFPGYEVTHDVRAFFRINRATNVDEAFAALENLTHGGQNWVIIDDTGKIGWTSIEQVPWRSEGCFTFSDENPSGVAPYLVLPGDGSCEWEGFMDARYIPHAIDPEKGYIATANADPIGETFDGDPLNGPIVDGRPLYVGAMYDSGFRVGRITRLIEAVKTSGEPMTLDKMGEIQGDVHSNFGERMRPHLLAALDALDAELAAGGPDGDLETWAGTLDPTRLAALAQARTYLEGWSLDTPPAVDAQATAQQVTDSVATTIFNTWAVNAMSNNLADELAAINEAPESLIMPRALLALYERPMETFVGVAAETNQALLCDDLTTEGTFESCSLQALIALDEALTWGTTRFGADMDAWRWGHLHVLVLQSMLPTDDLDVPPADDPVIPNGYPRHGDNYSVDSSDHGYEDYVFTYDDGPAIRHLTEFAGPGQPRTLFAIPGGQVLDRRSPHYRDIMDEYWSVNGYFEFPFTEAQIIDAAEDRWQLLPR